MGVGSIFAWAYAVWERGAFGRHGIGKFGLAWEDLVGLSCVGCVRWWHGAAR